MVFNHEHNPYNIVFQTQKNSSLILAKQNMKSEYDR